MTPLDYRVSEYSRAAPAKQRKKIPNDDRKYVDRSRLLFAVADGISLGRHGYIASGISVELFNQLGHKLYDDFIQGFIEPELMETKIGEIFTAINNVVFNSKHFFNTNSLGTTLDTGFIYGSTLYLGHVGDGRVYYYSKNSGLILLTEDHNLVPDGLNEQQREMGRAMYGKLEKHIGMRPEFFEWDYIKQELEPDWVVFAATDGVANCLSLSEMDSALSQKDFGSIKATIKEFVKTPKHIAEYLVQHTGIEDVEEARALLKRDDKSFVLIQGTEHASKKTAR